MSYHLVPSYWALISALQAEGRGFENLHRPPMKISYLRDSGMLNERLVPVFVPVAIQARAPGTETFLGRRQSEEVTPAVSRC